MGAIKFIMLAVVVALAVTAVTTGALPWHGMAAGP
jgi:hypothetical protein